MDIVAELKEITPYAPLPEKTQGFRAAVPAGWVEEGLAATGKASMRKRTLPAEDVVAVVIGAGLMRDRPLPDVISRLDLAWSKQRQGVPANSSITDARVRLGSEPMKWLLRRCGTCWATESARRYAWRGYALFALDGTKLTAPDTPLNAERFTKSTNNHGDSALPLVRVAILMAARSRIICAAEIGPWSIAEQPLARPLLQDVPDDSLLLIDRAFVYAAAMVELTGKGRNRQFLGPIKDNRDFTIVETLGPDDWVVEMNVSHKARQAEPHLPETWRARVIRHRHKNNDPVMLMTSLMDPVAYPAKELIELYRERWEEEIALDEIKTHQQAGAVLRSQLPDLVEQEIWGILLAHMLIRREMDRIAQIARVAASRISFVMVFRLILDEYVWHAITSPGAIPKRIQQLRENVQRLILPPRRDRSYPRQVRVRTSKYPRKTGTAVSG